MLTRFGKGRGRLALAGLAAALLLPLLPHRQAASDHDSSDDWTGSFDIDDDSEYVEYPYDSDLYKRWRCDLDAGCKWSRGAVVAKGSTYVNECVLKSAYHDPAGACWNTAPGKEDGDDGGGSAQTNCWLLGNCIMGQGPEGFVLDGSHSVTTYSETAAANPPTAVWVVLNDPTHYGFRFCTSAGWGQGSQWGTRRGPIDGEGHRLQRVGGGTPSPVLKAPFCGTWQATTPDPDPDPDPVECLRDGFVYFDEYGGCRPEDCGALSYGYVRDPDNGWCVPAPPPGDVPDACVANFEVLFPHLANLIAYDEPRERREHCNRRRLNYAPVWMTNHDGGPQREGASQTVNHRLLHITGVTPVVHPPFDGFDWNPDNRCDGADELNVHPAVSYDCVQVVVSVQAGFAGTDHGAWRFSASGCANPVGWRQNPDRSCDSADGKWSRTHGSDPQPADDPGDWTVEVGELERAGSSDYLVVVPFEVDVDDWGDADYLTVTATARDYWGARAGIGSQDTLTFEVRRRTGQPPTADTVDVNVADVAELRYRRGVRDERFVEVLRSTLLANDACPAGVDCTDPAQWPVTIPDPRAQRCSIKAFELRWSWRMLHTGQGLVGCDRLDDTGDPDEPAGVRYWPRLWAAGRDRFAYATPGGTAAVTVRFTDTPPETRSLSVRDRGESFAAVQYDYDRRRRCGSGWWGAYPCATPTGTATTGWMLTYQRDDSTAFDTPNRYHTGAEDLDASDADGDFSAMWLIDAAVAGDEQLRGGVKLGRRRVNLYPHTGDAAARAPGQALDASDDSWRHLAGYGNRCLSRPTESWHTPYNGVHNGVWAWDGTRQGTCKPSSRCPSTPAATVLCWSSWGRDDGADTTVAVDYRACDARYDALRSGRSAFGAYLASLIAGRWPHLTEYQVATAVSRHVGGSYRPSQIGAEDWKSITSAVDDHIDGRHCSRAAVTLQFGDCAAGLSDTQRAKLADEISWRTFIDVDPAGEPGSVWPPHPELPGGSGHLVVAGSPVWPRIDDPAALDFTDDGGCAWTADWVQTRATQMLPWTAAHRAEAEADADGRFEAWLRMWDSLDAGERAEAERSHADVDFESAHCPVADAADSTEPSEQNASYLRCRWTVPRPGVWRWQALAEFAAADSSRRVQAVLAEGLAWLRSFHAYTAQRTFTRSWPKEQ